MGRRALNFTLYKKLILAFLVSVFSFLFSFSQDTTSPTVVISDNASGDTVGNHETIRITGTFSENMAASPQISIGSLITNANMTQGGNASIWYYDWDVSTGSPSEGPVIATITGTDLAGNGLGSTTQMNKALHLNGSSYVAIQDNGNGQSYPLRRSPSGGVSGNQPWMVNVIFKRTATANQTIWAQRETGGGSSDKVKIKVNGSSLMFRYGRSSNYFRWSKTSFINQDVWYSITLKYNGGNVTQSSSFKFYQTDFSSGLTSDITESGSFSTVGSPSNSMQLDGNFFVGSDSDAEYFNGYIASVVVTTLKQSESPSLNEISMFSQDPLAWLANYKEGETFRAPNISGVESVNFQSFNNNKTGSQRSDFATYLWLMGDGKAGGGNNGLGTGSSKHVKNEVTNATESNKTRLNFNNALNATGYNRIEDVNITVPARRQYYITDTISPTVTLTSNDSDNIIKPGDNIIVTATFNENMASSPRMTIGSAVNNIALTATNSTTWSYTWNTSGVAEGSYTVTVTGTDIAGNSYTGTDTLKIILDSSSPEVLLVSDIISPTIETTNVVSISAYFSETLSTTPTLSISGLVTNTAMSKFSITPISQIGQSLDADAAGDWLGFYSQTSDSGNRIIVGGMRGNSGAGYARIYQWNGKQWVQLGNDINGASGDGYGRTVAISGDGNVVAVGGTGGAANSNRGKYGVYTLSGNTWTIRDNFIYGEAANDLQAVGSSIALNQDGSIVAFGAGKNKAGSASYNRGHIRVFRWDGTNLNQMGSDIDGDGTSGRLGEGSPAVDFSKDGLRLVAGAPTYNGNSGVVRIYDWNGSNAWIKIADITDPVDSSGSLIGRSVSMMRINSYIAIVKGSKVNVRIVIYHFPIFTFII